jgi:hypothetical protein
MSVNPVFREREFVFDPSLVFVLMPFGEPWSDRVWEAIQRIIAGYGVKAERADNRHGPVVTEDIWRGIVEARIVLADITGWNPNVFYELGIAHTVGKDVILVTQPSARLPFDTQGYRHIIYSDNPAGMKLLEREIPQKLDFYLKRPHPAPHPEPQQGRIGNRADLEASWAAISKGWDPPLPSLSTPDARSQAGALKKRMRQYAYVLSEEDAKTLVSDLRKAWPDDFDKSTDIQKAQDTVAAITNLLNDWRLRYATRVTR